MEGNWIEVELGKVSQSIQYGYTASSTTENVGPKFLRITDIQDRKVNWDEVPFCEIEPEKIEKYQLTEGDILFARTGATVGKTFLIRGEIPTSVFASYLIKVRTEKSALYDQFLSYFFDSPNYWIQITENQSGIGQPNVNGTKLGKLTIPIAPLPEQRAIVARIEELFSELDHAVSSLQSAQAKLEIYRQSVLKKAFEGGFKSDFSNSWKVLKTKEVCENIKVGIVIQPKKFYSDDENGIKAFRSANVREFRVNDTNWVYFSESGNKENYRTQLKEGDVLIVRSGYPGTSCVVPKKFEGCNAIDILIASPNKEIILPEYLCAFNNSPLGKGLFEDGSRGVAQKHLNVGVYSNLQLPVPSIREQQFILGEIESRLSVADKLAETIQTNLKKSEALRQSILKKAFEGRLLCEAEVEACRREADWEPAESLLARIERSRNERIKQEKSKPKKS